MHDDDTPTAAQDGWVELAAAMRTQLAKRADILAHGKATDIKDFVEAARSLYFLEINAATFDHAVSLEAAKTTASD